MPNFRPPEIAESCCQVHRALVKWYLMFPRRSTFAKENRADKISRRSCMVQMGQWGFIAEILNRTHFLPIHPRLSSKNDYLCRRIGNSIDMDKEISIAEWIEHRKFRGFYTFSLDEVKNHFSSFTPTYIATALNRLATQKIIISPTKSFYVIIPTEYALTGVVAPTFFVDQMMEFLKRKYYIGLLNAAEFYGAAHQRPQTFTIVNTYPEIRNGERSNIRFVFICRKDIKDKFIVRHKSRLGTINVSCAELTAIDLVANEEKVGGLNRVCSVLNDLVDSIDFKKVDDSIYSIYPISVYQRLGYILESILEENSLADQIYEALKRLGGRIRTIPFKKGKASEGYVSENRWKVIENQEIDIDE